MKKKVNGKTVDIKNMEVFEKAAEGLAANRTAISTVNDSVKVDMYTIKEYVTLYNAFYKSLPYPLYAIDNNVKYSAIATYIKKKETTEHPMWINNGLYICIDENTKIAINFINSTWGIVKVDEIKECNIAMQIYKNECGFIDLTWALSKILNKQSTASYYTEFMPEFIKACNNQSMLLKWELGNILEFGRVPNRFNFESNKIIDIENNKYYMLDIFVTGTRESKKKQQTWSFLEGEDTEETFGNKVVKQYGYEVYQKDIDTSDAVKKDNKIKRCELYGMMSIFNTLCLIKNITESDDFQEYQGMITGDTLIFTVNNRLFITTAYKFSEPKEIARGVELLALDRDMVFFTKPKVVAKGVRKETIYSYSLKDEMLRLCKVHFVNT